MGGLGSHALDVGSGSGFLSAVMALLVEPGGRVTGVEQVPALAERSLQSIQVRAPCPLPVYRYTGTRSLFNLQGPMCLSDDNVYHTDTVTWNS